MKMSLSKRDNTILSKNCTHLPRYTDNKRKSWHKIKTSTYLPTYLNNIIEGARKNHTHSNLVWRQSFHKFHKRRPLIALDVHYIAFDDRLPPTLFCPLSRGNTTYNDARPRLEEEANIGVAADEGCYSGMKRPNSLRVVCQLSNTVGQQHMFNLGV